jgi:hypothetical protein
MNVWRDQSIIWINPINPRISTSQLPLFSIETTRQISGIVMVKGYLSLVSIELLDLEMFDQAAEKS